MGVNEIDYADNLLFSQIIVQMYKRNIKVSYFSLHSQTYTENGMLSFWWNFCRWLLYDNFQCSQWWKFSSKWWHSQFSVGIWADTFPLSQMNSLLTGINNMRITRDTIITEIKSWIKTYLDCHLRLMIAQIDGLMQERHNSSADAMELRLSCINP